MSDMSSIDSVRPVPSATEGGAQEGRETPKQRKLKMLEEMRRKKQGDVPQEVLDFEKSNGVSVPKRPSSEPAAASEVPEKPARKKRQPVLHEEKPARRKFVISMEISDVGTYRTPAYDIIDANYGLFVVLPKGDNDTIFIPSVGSQITISANHMTYKCFYPGITAEIPGLDAVVLAFIKADGVASETT